MSVPKSTPEYQVFCWAKGRFHAAEGNWIVNRALGKPARLSLFRQGSFRAAGIAQEEYGNS